MTALTPYDTGDRLEPRPWVQGQVATPGGLPRRAEVEDYGRVDFDNDEGATVLTLYVERTSTGGYVLHLDSAEPVAIAGQDGGTQL